MLLAGCSAGGPSRPTPAESTTTDTTTREPCRTIAYESKPLPDPPADPTVVRLTYPGNKTDDPRRHGGEVVVDERE